jgi:uncharacterized repeat protein (TIGR01451 family)
VTNLGPDPATDVIVEDIPATDEPNTVADSLRVGEQRWNVHSVEAGCVLAR